LIDYCGVARGRLILRTFGAHWWRFNPTLDATCFAPLRSKACFSFELPLPVQSLCQSGSQRTHRQQVLEKTEERG